jgi:Reverse transcriptase (RNA-dependent DNA polymerase)
MYGMENVNAVSKNKYSSRLPGYLSIKSDYTKLARMIPCPTKDLREPSDGEKYCVYVAFAGLVPREDDELFDYVHPGEQVYVTTTKERRKCRISQDICKSVCTYTEEWLFDTGATMHIIHCKRLLFNTSTCCREIKVANGKYVHANLVGDVLLQSECGNFLVLQGVLYSLSFNKNIISAPQLMKNQDYIIIVKKDNYVELQYKGISLKMHMKTSENLYIFIGKRQSEHALKYLQLSTTENNSRLSHNKLHKNTNYKVVLNNLLNNGKGLTTRGRSIYMANDHQIDNTVSQGNISAPVNQGEISANQGEISAMKKAPKSKQPRLTRELRALGISQESDETSEEPRPSRSRMTRELRSLGTTPPAEESKTTTTSSNSKESLGEIHSAITSDPAVPTTFDEAFFGPMSHVWRPAIYEELMSFTNRKAFKKRDKKLVIEQLIRKLMTSKWIFKEKINPFGTIKYKARCVSRGLIIPGVDYTESFAPVASDSGIRIVIGIFLFFLHMFP